MFVPSFLARFDNPFIPTIQITAPFAPSHLLAFQQSNPVAKCVRYPTAHKKFKFFKMFQLDAWRLYQLTDRPSWLDLSYFGQICAIGSQFISNIPPMYLYSRGIFGRAFEPKGAPATDKPVGISTLGIDLRGSAVSLAVQNKS